MQTISSTAFDFDTQNSLHQPDPTPRRLIGMPAGRLMSACDSHLALLLQGIRSLCLQTLNIVFACEFQMGLFIA